MPRLGLEELSLGAIGGIPFLSSLDLGGKLPEPSRWRDCSGIVRLIYSN
jgi:hypothetical protein